MTFSPETNLWSAGMPLCGTRLLTEEEKADLRARAAGFQRKGLLALLAVPLTLALLFALVPLIPRSSLSTLSVPLILVTVITPLLALTARDCLFLARDLRRDLVTGRADRFEGPVGHATAIDGTLRRLVRAGLLRKGSGEPQWFEVLPASGLVWYANGNRPQHWIRASYAETANLPTYAHIAAEWVESVDNSKEDAFHIGRRDLSDAEMAELKRHLRRIVAKPAALAVVLNGWLIAALWMVSSGIQNLNGGHHVFLFAVLVAVTVQVDISLVKCITLGIKFARDLRLRIVVIVRSPSLLPKHPSGVTLLPPDEFLGCSGVLWSRSGSPAPWRLMPGR